MSNNILINNRPSKKLIRITTIPMALHVLLPGQMKFMSENGFKVIMISADGENLDKVIENEKCQHIIVPMTRKITPWQDLLCLFQLIKIFRKEKPDIVHSHTPKAGLLGMMAAKISGIKIRIHTVAGLPLMEESGLKYALLKQIEKITYSVANHVWPNSNSLYNFIKKNNLANEYKLKVIGQGSTNGVSITRFNKETLDKNFLTVIKGNINYDTASVYLLCIGRLVKHKGIVELVNVFSLLKKKYPHLKLILVGIFESSLDPLPKKILKQIVDDPCIINVGWSDNAEYYMSLAHYFVFPSYREGFPNVLLEAAAIQLPVLCSNIPGNTDIIIHNETGLLFEKKNEKDMYQKLKYALDNPKKMLSMANKLQHYIKFWYEREMYWKILLEEYNKLI
jgi:glycosyltransferase involved in cell wall biosynthesis